MSRHPLPEVRRDERIVCQVRVGAAHAIDFAGLSGAEGLARVETSRARDETLPAQHFLDTRNTTGEAVRGIEEGTVGVGHLDASLEQGRRHLVGVRK